MGNPYETQIQEELKEIYGQMNELKKRENVLACAIETQKNILQGDDCYICGSKENIQNHHVVTDKKYHDREEFVLSLCYKCHVQVHVRYRENNGKIYTNLSFSRMAHRYEMLLHVKKCFELIDEMKEETEQEES